MRPIRGIISAGTGIRLGGYRDVVEERETVRPFMLIPSLLVTRLPMGSSWLRFLNLLKRGFVWFKR